MELINHVISKLERIKNEYDRDLETFDYDVILNPNGSSVFVESKNTQPEELFNFVKNLSEFNNNICEMSIILDSFIHPIHNELFNFICTKNKVSGIIEDHLNVKVIDNDKIKISMKHRYLIEVTWKLDSIQNKWTKTHYFECYYKDPHSIIDNEIKEIHYITLDNLIKEMKSLYR